MASFLVSQARPFPSHSAGHFQYAALKAIGAVEQNGSCLRDYLVPMLSFQFLLQDQQKFGSKTSDLEITKPFPCSILII